MWSVSASFSPLLYRLSNKPFFSRCFPRMEDHTGHFPFHIGTGRIQSEVRHRRHWTQMPWGFPGREYVRGRFLFSQPALNLRDWINMPIWLHSSVPSSPSVLKGVPILRGNVGTWLPKCLGHVHVHDCRYPPKWMDLMAYLTLSWPPLLRLVAYPGSLPIKHFVARCWLCCDQFSCSWVAGIRVDHSLRQNPGDQVWCLDQV